MEIIFIFVLGHIIRRLISFCVLSCCPIKPLFTRFNWANIKIKGGNVSIPSFRGAGGSRTRVQTCCKNAFYTFSLSLIVGGIWYSTHQNARLSSKVSLTPRSRRSLFGRLRCFVPDADRLSFRGNIQNYRPCLCFGIRAIKRRMHKSCHLLAKRVSF